MRDDGVTCNRRELSVPLGDFVLEAARSAGSGPRSLEAVARQAIDRYLEDRGSRRPGWLYPSFARAAGVLDAPVVSIVIDADDATWREFVREAGAQDVRPELLLRHAVLYYAADFDAGRARASG